MTESFFRRAGVIGPIVVAAAVLGLLIPSVATAAKTPKGPSGDAFYQPPEELPSGHGTPIWKRGAQPIVRIDGARYTRRILYTSRSTQGEKIAVSGSISIPPGEPPSDGWPVISYAHGTTGLADVCAPSRDYKGGLASSAITYVNPQLEAWIDAGYAVVRTDYEGLGTPGQHPFLVGKSEGRGVLDIVRAAARMDDRIGDRFLIAGHSQGGHAALFAAGLADSWAPDLELRGTVSYAPASHLLTYFDFLPTFTDPSSLSAYATMALVGTSTANQGIDPAAILNPEPENKLPLIDGLCNPQLGGPGRYGQFAPSKLVDPNAKTALLKQVLAKNNPDVVTDQPILLAQGSDDTTVFPLVTDLLNGELVASGDSVDYMIYDGVGHGDIVAAAEPDALAFMKDRLPPG